jgi:hypothetical protein
MANPVNITISSKLALGKPFKIKVRKFTNT